MSFQSIMKKFLLLIAILFSHWAVFCQTADSNNTPSTKLDTSRPKPLKKVAPKKKLFHANITIVDTVYDSLDNMPPPPILYQDTLKRDSLNKIAVVPVKDIPIAFIDYNIVFNNKLLNTSTPVFHINSEHKQKTKEITFYIISFFLLIFGLFKVFYAKYFHNVFKVFFNTSLRQNQLTDILIQAKLASLIFNSLFIISGGLYLWQLLIYKNYFNSTNLISLPLCILAIAVIYLVKFLVIKLMGWVTTFKSAANQYIFVIFLINKMIAVFLLPFIVLFSFGPPDWLPSIILLSFLLLGTLFLLRYFRTYGLLQKQLSLNVMHFIIYFAATEILPVLALYKFFGSLSLNWQSFAV